MLDVSWSAILTTYNAENTVERAVDSILSQSHKPTEIIIVDDRSTDMTCEYLRKVANQFSIIQLIELKMNSGGASVPRNIGIKKMKTEFGIIFDDDDYSHPNRAKIQLDQLINNCDFSYVGSRRIRNEDGGLEEVTSEFYLERKDLEVLKFQVLLGVKNKGDAEYLLPSSVLAFKRKAINSLGGFDESLERCEDIDLAIRAVNFGFTLSSLPEILVDRFVINRSHKSKSKDILIERQLQLKYQSTWSRKIRIVSYLHFRSRLAYSRSMLIKAVLWSIPLTVLSPRILSTSYHRRKRM